MESAMETRPTTDTPGTRNAELHVETLTACVDLIRLMRLDPQRYPYLLESVAPEQSGRAQPARYDILFAFPGETLALTTAGLRGGGGGGQGFLTALDEWWRREQAAVANEHDLPFTGGWFLYLGYELAGEIEPSVDLQPAEDQPIAFATRVPVAVINDRLLQQTYLVAEQSSLPALQQLRADIAGLEAPPPGCTESSLAVDLHEDEPDDFLRAVDRAQHYIRQGEVFQANLSRRWRGSSARRVARGSTTGVTHERGRRSPGP